MKENVLETYTIKALGEIEINIVKPVQGLVLEYRANLPEYGLGTRGVLTQVKHELLAGIGIAVDKMSDPLFLEKMKTEWTARAEILLKRELPQITPATQMELLGLLMNEMFGLGPLEVLLADGNLEEVVINQSREPVWVYHKKYGWLKTDIVLADEGEIENYANIIARRIGKQITVLNPLLDAHLLTGDRVNATLFPISGKGNTLTIRRFRRDPWTCVDLIENKTISSDAIALLWEAMQYEQNIIVSGGTASGKTTILGSMIPFIQPNHRVLSIEDTREIQVPEFMHWIPLTTRSPNPEGKGAIEMIDLLVNSLRMRPDRIIVGEIRRKNEAEVMFEAMHTGHSVYATVHANTAEETVRRLTSPPIQVPIGLLEAVNLNIVVFRNRRLGVRRLLELAEFVPEKHGANEEGIKTNVLYRWRPAQDSVEKYNDSIRFYDDLNLHTGLSRQEIDQEISEKKIVLEWMQKQKIRNIESVGKVIAVYYQEPEKIVQIAENNRAWKDVGIA